MTPIEVVGADMLMTCAHENINITRQYALYYENVSQLVIHTETWTYSWCWITQRVWPPPEIPDPLTKFKTVAGDRLYMTNWRCSVHDRRCIHSKFSQTIGLLLNVNNLKIIGICLLCCFVRKQFHGKIGVLIRQPEGRAYVLPVMYLSFFSPRVLRVPSTDRPETLPHGRNLAEFHNPTPKIRGALPQKNLGAKNMQNFGQFWTTSDLDREYLRNGSRYPKLES